MFVDHYCWFYFLSIPICGSMQALESGKLAQGGGVGSAGSTAISLATAAIKKVYIWKVFSISGVP